MKSLIETKLLTRLVEVVAGRLPVTVEQVAHRVGVGAPLLGALVLVVRPCVHEALELDHVHELRVVASISNLAVSIEAESLAIIDDFNPEALLIRAPFS